MERQKKSVTKSELVLTAVQLARLGEELDTARAELKRLAESGAAYDSEEMKTALQSCQALNLRWSALEQEYLVRKDSVTGESKA